MYARLLVAIGLAYGCTAEVPASAPLRSSTIELGNGDRIVIARDGTHTYVGADGSTHTLLAQPRGAVSGEPGRPKHIDIVGSGGGSTSPCADVTVTVDASRPTQWDLEGVFAGSGQNLMSPVDNQGNRAACWAFAQVSQIEMEYVRQFSLAHDAASTAAYAQTMLLSKEYYLAMTSLETGGPTYSEFASVPAEQVPAGNFVYPQLAVGDMTDLNQTCGGLPLLGLPPETDWPYIERDMAGVYPMMQSDPLVVGGTNVIGATDSQTFMDQFQIGGTNTPYDGTALLANNLSYAFNLDLANFYWQPGGTPTNSAYPPPAVHEDARYAPLAVQFMNVFIADAYTTSAFALEVKVPSWPLTLEGCSQATLVDYPIVTSGMTPGADQISCLNTLAAPYETLLALNHPIVITTRPNNWKYDSGFLIDPTQSGSYPPAYWNNSTAGVNTTEVLRFSNNIDGDPDTTQHYWPLIDDPNADQHFVVLIGYDHEHQWFHFKNELGTNLGTGQGAGNDGTFWMTYDLLFRTQFTEPEYINGVSDPLLALSDPSNPAPVPAPIPNGNWFGFWQATVGGTPGVAIVGHFNSNDRGTNLIQGTYFGQTGNPAGTFYPSDGSPSIDFQMTSWWSSPTTYSASFGDTTASASPLFTLTATFGASPPSAQFIDTHGGSATWFKCGSAMTEAAGKFTGTMTLVPQTYLDTLSDPYVLPPCTTMPWHVAPTWSCNAGDTYFEFDGYDVGYGTTNFAPYAPNQDEIKRLCVRPSATAPSCPAGYVVKPDLFNTNIDNALLTYSQSLDGCVLATDTTCLACNAPTVTCDVKCNKAAYAPPTCPTPSGLTATSRMPVLGAFAGPEGDGRQDELWELPQPGLDVCVAGNYPPTATCPSDYYLSPNGTDCVPLVLPPHLPPPPPGPQT